MAKPKKGLFITLEGPDGCGKTTQAGFLIEWLRGRGREVVHTREPGGTGLAEKLRSLILDPSSKISPLAELMLYEAARAQHTDEIIRPALEDGRCVVSERYYDSTTAYQGYGRGLPPQMIDRLNRAATAGLKPDLSIVLDVPAALGLARARKLKEQGKGDRLEQEAVSFHERVRKGFHAIARKEPKRVKIIDASGTLQEVQQKIRQVVEKKFR
jgi:dTMP kinase